MRMPIDTHGDSQPVTKASSTAGMPAMMGPRYGTYHRIAVSSAHVHG